jgi:hypothetical protein
MSLPIDQLLVGAAGHTLWTAPARNAYDTERERDLAWALGAFAARRRDYELYHDYLAGKHRRFWKLRDTGGEFTEFLQRVAVNLCPRVVAAFTDRLRIIGFEPHANAAAATAIAEAAWALWQDRRLERHFNQVFSTAVGYGDGYLLVWPDAAGRAQFYPESPLRAVAGYDAETRALSLGARLWLDGRRYRLNLYYPNRIERYIAIADNGALPSAPSGFRPFREAPDGGAVVMNPYGRVPLFHFAFEGGVGEFGVSSLAPVLPIQDDYNVAAATLAVVREYQAWPLRYAIGLDPDQEITVGPDRMIIVRGGGDATNDRAAFGQFEAANLQPYFDNKQSSLMEISAVTGIPPHLLYRGIANPPSGEALKTSEAPLASRVEKAQTGFGDEAENAVAFGLVIERQAASADEGASLTALWQSAYTRSDRDEAEVAAIKVERIGLPWQTITKELGYSENEVAQMEQQKEAEAVAAVDALDASLSRAGAQGSEDAALNGQEEA